MTEKFKVLVTRKWPSTVEKKLDESFDVTLNESDIPMTEEQWMTVIDAVNDKYPDSDCLDILINNVRYFPS